ncbi:MAG: DUF4190 domain-containing protein [Candidatus Woesearchaeota archaeon]
MAKSGLSIAALILGIVALLFSWTLILGLICGILAIIFGIIVLVGIKNNPKLVEGKTFAIIGLVLGIIALVLSFVFIIPLIAYFGVLNPAKFTPDMCVASSGADCLSKPLIGTNSVMLSVGSGLGYDVTIDTSGISNSLGCVTYEACDLGGTDCSVSKTLKDSEGITIKLSECTFPLNPSNANVIRGEIKLNYTNPQSKLSENIIIGITGKKG